MHNLGFASKQQSQDERTMTTKKTILNRNFEPKKLVVSPADLALLEKSECLALIAAFLEQLNGSVIGLKRSDSKAESKTVNGLLGLIANCNDAIAKYPRTEDGGDSRFGHPQFRAYYDYIDKVRILKHYAFT